MAKFIAGPVLFTDAADATSSGASGDSNALIRTGTLQRSITLPSHVMADAIEASAQDGVLEILVPKAAEVHAKRIQVRASEKQADPAPVTRGETSR